MHIEEDASNMSTVIFYFTAMYKCASTHCTSAAKIAPQKMSGHSKSRTAVQQRASHTHTHTHENFGNDDMYSTFVRNKPTMRGAATLTCPKYCGSNALRHPCLNLFERPLDFSNGLFLQWQFKQQGPSIRTDAKGKF